MLFICVNLNLPLSMSRQSIVYPYSTYLFAAYKTDGDDQTSQFWRLEKATGILTPIDEPKCAFPLSWADFGLIQVC